MGHYSTLRLGEFQFQWKSYMPPIAMLLFSPDEYLFELEKESEDDFQFVSKCGYYTTAKKSKLRYESIGYNINLISKFYEMLQEDIEALTDFYIDKSPLNDNVKSIDLTIQKSIELFVQLLHHSVNIDFENSRTEFIFDSILYNLPVLSLREITTYKDEIIKFDITLFDYEKLQEYLQKNTNELPRGLINVLCAFEDEFRFEYDDVLLLITLFCSLHAIGDNTDIWFDYGDLLYGQCEDFYEDHYNSLYKKIVDKINIQNIFFNQIKDNSNEILNNYSYNKLQVIWNDIKSNDYSSQEKGQLFEEFVVMLLKLDSSVVIESKNFKVRDEEIDILFSYNFGTNFWNSFNSPCILIECKNWTNKVGVSELRNFEVKIRNHKNFAKIGFFVSANEFCDDSIKDYLKRLGRDEFVIAPINGKDISELLENRYSLEQFLRRRMIESIK